jgi:hypothetical protein
MDREQLVKCHVGAGSSRIVSTQFTSPGLARRWAVGPRLQKIRLWQPASIASVQ